MRRDNRPSFNVQPAAHSTWPPCRTAPWRASTRVQQKPEWRGERSPRPYRLARISTIRPDGVAHALVRAVSRLLSTLRWGTASLSGQGVGTSADAARMSACATSSPPNVCEKSGLKDFHGIRSFAGKEQFRVGGIFDRNKKHRPRSRQHMLGTQQEKGGGSAAPPSIEIPSLADEAQNMYFSANSSTRGTLFLYNGKPVVVVLRLVKLKPHGAGALPQEPAAEFEKFRLTSPLPDMANCLSAWFMKLNADIRNSILWCSLKVKSL